MAVSTADLPDPFSPDRKVSLWLGWKVNVYNKQWNVKAKKDPVL